jgi:DNA-directed RNA polymerase specialized sigma24 family protein
MIEDTELLRCYAREKSEAASAELVRRRVDLVYSVARRQVGGDAQLAEDVTQRVFADLACKAAALSRRVVLSGWLYRSAQFAAADVVRAGSLLLGSEIGARASALAYVSESDPPAAHAAGDVVRDARVQWGEVFDLLFRTRGSKTPPPLTLQRPPCPAVQQGSSRGLQPCALIL